MTAKQRKRRKPISEDYMLPIEPLTHNQRLFFDEWDKGQMIYAYGVAGTGKTFVALYKALKDVLNEYTPYEKIYIVRSLVSTREIGFLPGDHEDKSDIQQQETISFWSTSFIRGTTLDNAIVIIDECQNLNFHELDSIITRIGQDTKVVFCGDASQTDLTKISERSGILDFQRILQNMDEFSLVEFDIEDIVRSGLVKSYLINKINLGL